VNHHNLLALFGTMLVLAVVPGPSDVMIIARSATSGFLHGALMTLGIIVADLVFILIAVLSLAAAADVVGPVFTWVRYLSAAYLLWLGVGLMRAPATTATDVPLAPASPGGSLFAGFSVTFGDPKAILFYLGLFPAFVDLPTITVTDTVLIMLIATGVVGGVKLGYAWAADRARTLLADATARQRLNQGSGLLLIGIAAWVVLAG